MDDPYWRYSVPPERGSIPKPSLPGFLSTEAATVTTHHPWGSNGLRGGSDYLDNDVLQSRPSAYGMDVGDIHPGAGLGGLTSGTNTKGCPSPLKDPSLLGQRSDAAPHIPHGIHETNYERPSSLRRTDDLPGESNILFVDGLPTDCTRREVGHLFRPFIGFRELRVVHKEPRHSGDKAMVLCFVEFADAKCALTAMEALQDAAGYKFDDKKPDSPVLRLHFAHFPFRLPSNHDEQLFGGLR